MGTQCWNVAHPGVGEARLMTYVPYRTSSWFLKAKGFEELLSHSFPNINNIVFTVCILLCVIRKIGQYTQQQF
jgi:hypothetical protein